MQSADEFHSLSEMFEQEAKAAPSAPEIKGDAQAADAPFEAGKNSEKDVKTEGSDKKAAAASARTPPPVFSESQALSELPAMPLYFASSYALVKPYVIGFDTNLLDAPSLKHVRIDTSWQRQKQASITWFKADR
jgi:hypothetical protein